MGPKKKKTKAEIAEEKLAKELEDKKQKELEEKRQLVEAERRKIEDVKIQEMRKKIRESELDRLSSESVHRLELLEAFQQRLRYERAQVQERTQWFKFLNPAEDPDPSSERELNTFLSILNELPRSSFANVMHMCSRLEKVATPLRAQWGDDYAKQNYAMQLNSANFLESFSKIVLEQLDQATVNILRLADAHLNDKAELVVEEHSADVYIGLWAYFGTSSLPRKEVKFSKLGFEISVPKQILQNETRFVHRVIRFPLETQSLAAYHPDSSRPEFVGNTSKYVIGDVHIVELLIPPPMSSRIRAKKWVIRDRSAASLKLRKSAYPSTATMKCTIRVPDSLVIGGDVRAMMWSPETSDWTEAGVSEFLWTAAERKVEFYLTALGTVALVRDRVSELPYKHWSLRSLRSAASSQDAHSSPNAPISDVYEQSARLSLWTERMLIVIDIVGDVCRLVQPDDRSTADVVGRDMTPGALCGLLLRRGVNIMPSQHDFARALGSEALVKDKDLEDAVLLEMSRVANAVDFEGHAEWNRQLPRTQIGLLAQESTSFSSEEEAFDLECVLAERDDASESHRSAESVGTLASPGVKFTLVLGNEYGTREGFSLLPRPDEVSHAQLAEALSSRATEEGRERVQRATASFQDTVFTLLRIVRPLSLCFAVESLASPASASLAEAVTGSADGASDEPGGVAA